MRSGRLISCLQLLQGERHLTARYLAEQLAVSVRTVYRDVDALCEAGVPIHMERGPHGGIVLADGYRRALAQFTNDELQSLFAAGPGPLSDLGIAGGPTALRKLAGALPQHQRQAAETAREQLLVDHNRWGRGEQPTAVLAQLRAAIAAQHRVRLRYRDRSGTATERLVEPLGLAAKAGVWYAIANEPGKGYRTFRAERIVSISVARESFIRPADFDLRTYWESSVTQLERRPDAPYTVVARVTSSRRDAFAYWQPAVIEETADVMLMRIPFSSRAVAIAEIIMLDDAVEIVEPLDLVTAVVACAEATLQRYRPAGGDDGT